MNLEGKVSKVAICKNCNGYVLATLNRNIDSETEKEFTELEEEGYIIKVETIEETRARNYVPYESCNRAKHNK